MKDHHPPQGNARYIALRGRRRHFLLPAAVRGANTEGLDADLPAPIVHGTYNGGLRRDQLLGDFTPVQGHQASGGKPPYNYTSDDATVIRVTDARLGILQAVPSGSNLNINVTDSANPQASTSYPVATAFPRPEMSPNGKFTVTVGQTFVLTATGGTPPYRWAINVNPTGGIQLSNTTG